MQSNITNGIFFDCFGYKKLNSLSRSNIWNCLKIGVLDNLISNIVQMDKKLLEQTTSNLRNLLPGRN